MISVEAVNFVVAVAFMLWVSLCLAFMIGGIMFHAWTKEQDETDN